MARIVSFKELEPTDRVRWHTGVKCGYRILTKGGLRILHLETYGSNTRKIPGKVSQSLQVDEGAAGQLKSLIGRAFPGLR